MANERRLAEGPNTMRVYVGAVLSELRTYDYKLLIAVDPNDTEASVALYLSPQHAKALAQVLQQNVSTYERLFGPINLIPDPQVAKEVASTSEGRSG